MSVAYPGFPRGEYVKTRRGSQSIIWPIFPQNCIETKKFWAGGGGPSRLHPDPPMNVLFVTQYHFIYSDTY